MKAIPELSVVIPTLGRTLLVGTVKSLIAVKGFERPDVGLVSGPGLVPEGVSLMTRLAGITISSAAAGYVSERYLKGQSSLRQIGSLLVQMSGFALCVLALGLLTVERRNPEPVQA